ncbi:MAG TPA: RagB/SusD family nutrient uptake outer membrane protein [Chitinophagaceae bacterium]
MKTTSIIKVSLSGLMCIAVSCTDLDEKKLLYDTVISDNFYRTDAELASAVRAAYQPLYGFGGNNHMIPLNEVTTDEMVVPQRGADWGDGGHWVRLQTHTYNATDPTPNNGWNFCYTGISTINKLLITLANSTSPSAGAFVSELKALRAIYYYWLLDMFGNVPIVTDFSNTTPPSKSDRKTVYDFVEKELLDNIDQLPKEGPQDGPYYGRVTYYVVKAALAKLYLNAQVYTGTAQWDKAIAACDDIINSGLYALAPNYLDNFVRNNTGSPEFIWAVPYDGVKAQGFNMDMMTLSYLNQATYNINAQPWNGFATIQEFYQSYIDPAQNPGPQGTVVGLDPKGTPTTGTVDKRLSNFIVGPQYASDGSVLEDGGADATDPDGPPLTFTPYINELQPNAWRQSGARIGKWQFYNGMQSSLDNDWAIFRYADILLTKAEAIARKNNNWNDPITLATINQIRTDHGGVDPFTTLTADTFLAERAREMFAETFRRQDMIRFGKYNNAWRFHSADPSDNLGPNNINHLNIFPIPETQLNANQNLTQNPGY